MGVLPPLVPGDEGMGYCPYWYQGMKGWGTAHTYTRDGVLPPLVPGDEGMGYCPYWYQGMKGWDTAPLVRGMGYCPHYRCRQVGPIATLHEINYLHVVPMHLVKYFVM